MPITQTVSNETLQEAIELRISEYFPAMNVANALGGTPSPAWDVARANSLSSLVADACDRLMPVREFRAAVSGTLFMDTAAYMRLRNEIGNNANFPR